MNWKDDVDVEPDNPDALGNDLHNELTADLIRHGVSVGTGAGVKGVGASAVGDNNGGMLADPTLLESYLLHNEPKAATDWFLNSVPHLTSKSTMLAFSFDDILDDLDDELNKRFDAIFVVVVCVLIFSGQNDGIIALVFNFWCYFVLT